MSLIEARSRPMGETTRANTRASVLAGSRRSAALPEMAIMSQNLQNLSRGGGEPSTTSIAAFSFEADRTPASIRYPAQKRTFDCGLKEQTLSKPIEKFLGDKCKALSHICFIRQVTKSNADLGE
jgi:hypothetical protein